MVLVEEAKRLNRNAKLMNKLVVSSSPYPRMHPKRLAVDERGIEQKEEEEEVLADRKSICAHVRRYVRLLTETKQELG